MYPRPVDACWIDGRSPAKLMVVVDTEEDFDWSDGFSRERTSVASLRRIHRVQDIFDEYGITPVYVIDYPVASQPDGYRPLQEIHASGRCVIGTHLHPWVSPPFEEAVTRRLSFPGNLPRTLEASKLRILSETIAEQFGMFPTVYKAGRYGVGPNTAAILEEQGYEVDLSVCPYMNYSSEGGPDFTTCPPSPYWFGERRSLLECPLTVGYAGVLRSWGTAIHGLASSAMSARLHGVGILARSGLLDKIWLSPEGFVSSEHVRLTRTLHADGLRVFSFAFHSPSVAPGNTPYVRCQADLDTFLSRCRDFFDFFMGALGGQPTTPLELKNQLSHGGAVRDGERQ